MLRLKPSLARSTQVVRADQALYTDTELKPEQKVLSNEYTILE